MSRVVRPAPSVTSLGAVAFATGETMAGMTPKTRRLITIIALFALIAVPVIGALTR